MSGENPEPAPSPESPQEEAADYRHLESEARPADQVLPADELSEADAAVSVESARAAVEAAPEIDRPAQLHQLLEDVWQRDQDISYDRHRPTMGETVEATIDRAARSRKQSIQEEAAKAQQWLQPAGPLVSMRNNPDGFLSRPPEEAAADLRAIAERSNPWAAQAVYDHLENIQGEGGPHAQRFRALAIEQRERLAKLAGAAAANRYLVLQAGEPVTAVSDEVRDYTVSLFLGEGAPGEGEKQEARRPAMVRKANREIDAMYDDPDGIEALAGYWASGLHTVHGELYKSAYSADSVAAASKPGLLGRLRGGDKAADSSDPTYDAAEAVALERAAAARAHVRKLRQS
jgi:hypothetical protein